MTKMSESLALDEISVKMAEVLLASKAYDRVQDFVNLDNVWQSPNSLSEFSDLLAAYIKHLQKSFSISSIVATHNIQFPYGIVPIAALVSAKLSLPLAIWQEGAVPLTSNSWVSGYLTKKNILILHDVIRYGVAVSKTILDLNETGASPELVLGIVDAEKELDIGRRIKQEIKANLSEQFTVISVMKISTLKEMIE